ncbi:MULTISPECIES: type II toxin-antitoxin system HipA family toxin [Serratia]|uniref:type II toxin-antitoxin system HipA family toxin n=1 Tax=Serratia TaxID=613 RepID=UPI00216921D1|nr:MULTISPECIES: type II toxin-antitoxin system HipA family toxin [Serratia]MCS4267114.1 serine/threonine-protein kinase HipA [Serratia sp. BIGb0163]
MLDIPLLVKRRLSDGNVQNVGQLAENATGVYFRYDESYLASHQSSLSPFNLPWDNFLHQAPKQPHYGLEGVFADSLPDGWGLYLMDRVFRQNGYNPRTISVLERLAFTGERGFGALFYEPDLPLSRQENNQDLTLITLGNEAVKEFEGTESHLIAHLMAAGGSGGARPKLSVTRLADGTFSSQQDAVGKKLLVKLTSEKFALGHRESQIEYVYMMMARQAGIEVADFTLIDIGKDRHWLEQERFDCVGDHGRRHMISASGLLDAPFREPSLDYVDLIKATRILCGVEEARKLLRRALFNYLTVNQDDHAKNFAFLADDQDNWRLSPCYDIVYSPSPYGQHMTAFNGNGSKITASAMTMMAGQAGLANAKAVMNVAEEIYSVVSHFQQQANTVGLPTALAKEIQRDIDGKWLALRSANQ